MSLLYEGSQVINVFSFLLVCRDLLTGVMRASSITSQPLAVALIIIPGQHLGTHLMKENSKATFQGNVRWGERSVAFSFISVPRSFLSALAFSRRRKEGNKLRSERQIKDFLFPFLFSFFLGSKSIGKERLIRHLKEKRKQLFERDLRSVLQDLAFKRFLFF